MTSCEQEKQNKNIFLVFVLFLCIDFKDRFEKERLHRSFLPPNLLYMGRITMLTAKQRDLLMLIHERLQESGVSPSFEEMKETLGLRSKSGIHRLIRALEERGFLRRLPHRARALEVLRLPDHLHDRDGQKRAGFCSSAHFYE